jgi:two-component system chemotaxis response regulator CheB
LALSDGTPQPSPRARDIIVVGASLGGVEALSRLVARLPADLRAAVFVVLHTLPARKSLLAEILGRAGALPVDMAQDEQPIRLGRIYVAPADQHLVLAPGQVRVLHGPKVNGHRPAVDPLFASAADAYGPRVIGVVLTGGQDCGTAGLQNIKQRGGVAIIQDPATALCPEMPVSARENVAIDYSLPLDDIPAALVKLVSEPLTEARPEEVSLMSEPISGPRSENGIEPLTDDAQSMTPSDAREWRAGTPTDFSCPDCGGVLRQVPAQGKLIKFRCRIGHAMSMDALGEEQESALDLALSAAMRALSERADLCRRVAQRFGPELKVGTDYEAKARHAEAQAAMVRQVLIDRGTDRPTGNELVQWAVGLPRNDRARIAREILDSLDEPGQSSAAVAPSGSRAPSSSSSSSSSS